MTALPFEAADLTWIGRLHEQVYIDRLKEACKHRAPFIDVPDSATLHEADRIMREDWDWEFHLICECPQVRKIKLRLNPLLTA